MITISLLMIFFTSFGYRADITRIYHCPDSKTYTFKNWDEIKSALTTDVLRGNDIDKISMKMAEADNLLIRIIEMKLTQEEANVIKSYLIKFLEEYLNDKRFVELIESKAFINQEGEYSDFQELPRYIIRTIAILNPSQQETDQCVEIIRKVKNKELVTAYFYDLMICLFHFSSGRTADKYLDNINMKDYSVRYQNMFARLRIYAKIKYSKDRNEVWEKLSKDFADQFNTLTDANTQEVSSSLYTFMGNQYNAYTLCHKDYYNDLPFQLYKKTEVYSEKYFLAIQISHLLSLAVIQDLISKDKLFEEYHELKNINDELLNYPVPENSKMGSLKSVFKTYNDSLIECIQEKYPEFKK